MTLRQQLARGARARGLDPHAVLAVSATEGLYDQTGDEINGRPTSFGAFMLHEHGALPRRLWGRPQAALRWANSPAGIDYALDQIARIARGLHGHAAVDAIVRRFERPANPDAEVQKAMGLYGSLGGGTGPGLSPRPAPAGGTAAAAPAPELRRETGMALIQAMQPGPSKGDFSQVYSLLQQRAQAEAEHHVTRAATTLKAAGKPVTPQSLFGLLKSVGMGDAVTSGYRPGSRTAHGTTSYHSQKDAGGRSRAYDLNPNDPDAKKLIAYATAHPQFFKEFIYARLPWFIKNGKRYPISQLNKTDRDNHYDHIHAAH